MKDLGTLIRLHRWQVDEKRLKLKELETLVDYLQQQLQDLEQQMVHEQQMARDHHDLSHSYPAFLKDALNRRENLQQSIAHAKHNVELALDELAEVFRDLKKYEITQSRRDAQELQELNKLENDLLDEVGLSLHQRLTAQEQ